MISAVVLTLAAGYVDSVGYLRLGGIYVANMSGNSIAIGIHSATGPGSEVYRRLLPVAAYVMALVSTRVAINVADRTGFRRIVGCCLLTEVFFLLLFVLSKDAGTGTAMAATAMGIQAAAIVRFSGVTVYTAFVTGSLVKLAENIAEVVVRLMGGQHRRIDAVADSVWFAAIWAAYVGGAFFGASAFTKAGGFAAVWACVVLAGFATLHLFRPTP
jgi:uncharacterized membrane protein YoaK (UPF0700 family)